MKDNNNPNGSNEQDQKIGPQDPERKDPEMQEKSGGPQEENKDREQPNKDIKPGKKDREIIGEGDADPDLPNKKQPDDKPYIGDNPEETERQAPKMK